MSLDDPTLRTRVRRFLPVALLPNLLVVLLAIFGALVGLFLTNTTMAALPSFIAQFWLVFNLGPVVGRGQMIGLLPILPAVLLVWVVAWRVRVAVRVRVSLADLAVLTACVLGIPVLLTLTACAMLVDASLVFDLNAPPVYLAMLNTVTLHLVALGAGMGLRLWKALFRRFEFPEWIPDMARTALRGLGYLLICALILTAVLIGTHWSEVRQVYELYPASQQDIAVSLVSLLYLPNFLIALAAALFGGEVAFGQGVFSLFGVTMVPIPPLPLLAALPQRTASYALALLVIPALCVLAAIYKQVPRAKEILALAAFAASFTFISSYLAGGTLGVYGHVGPTLGLVTLFSFLFFGVFGLLTAAVAALLNKGVASTQSLVDASAGPDSTAPDSTDPDITAPDSTAVASTAPEAEDTDAEDAQYKEAEPEDPDFEELKEPDSEFAEQSNAEHEAAVAEDENSEQVGPEQADPEQGDMQESGSKGISTELVENSESEPSQLPETPRPIEPQSIESQILRPKSPQADGDEAGSLKPTAPNEKVREDQYEDLNGDHTAQDERPES